MDRLETSTQSTRPSRRVVPMAIDHQYSTPVLRQSDKLFLPARINYNTTPEFNPPDERTAHWVAEQGQPDLMDYQHGLSEPVDYRPLFDNFQRPSHDTPYDYNNTEHAKASTWNIAKQGTAMMGDVHQRTTNKVRPGEKTSRLRAGSKVLGGLAGAAYGATKGAAIGTALGGPVGTAVGGFAGGVTGFATGTYGGDVLGSGVSQMISGRGDYVIGPTKPKYNVLTNAADVPQFKTKGRTNVVTHREYIQDIFTGPTLTGTYTDFHTTDFTINPGLQHTFPWLYAVAKNYEEYIVHGMVFEFKSTSADALNSTNTNLGAVIMATQYNVNSLPFLTKQQMENYEFSMSAKPSQSQLHAIECSPKETPIEILYVRTGDLSLPYPQGSTIEDGRFYDLARFTIGTAGMQAANVLIGELWVTYHIELLKPKIPRGISSLSAHIQTSGATGTNPWGTQIIGQKGNLNAQLFGSRGLRWDCVPGGKYLIQWNVAGTAVVGTYQNITNSHCLNCKLLQYHTNGSAFDIEDQFNGANPTTTWNMTLLVQVIPLPTVSTNVNSNQIGLDIPAGAVMPINPLSDIWIMEMADSVDS